MSKLVYSGETLATVVLDTSAEINAVRVAINIALRQGDLVGGLDRSVAEPLENLRILLTA